MSSRRLLTGALALAVIVAAAAWVVRGPKRRPRIERVVLLGFDGAAPNLIAPLLAEGKLPAMARLIQGGAYGPLHTDRPTKSAVLWNSIATGKTMLKHGIVDWTYVSQAGIVLPYQDRKRRAKTYWEILDERGFKTTTLNWWVSHPPYPLRNGILVSNAFKGRGGPASVHPAALFASLDALRVGLDEVPGEMKRLGLREWRQEDASIAFGNTRSILEAYRYYVAQDLTVERASAWLFERRPTQAFSTYFRLVDVTAHLAGNYLDPALYEQAAAGEREGRLAANEEGRIDRAFAAVLEPVYANMDRIIAWYLDRIDERTLLVICSDHGFRFHHGWFSHANPEQEPPDGVLFVHGPGVRKRLRLRGATIYDVAPTLLYALGQPAAADMDGQVLQSAFEPGFLRRLPVRTVPTFEARPRDEARGARSQPEVDRDVLQDLATIGYIGTAPSPSPTPKPR
jgi:predicted AlkP superfamily phosphohydrolase/phosphomutase